MTNGTPCRCPVSCSLCCRRLLNVCDCFDFNQSAFWQFCYFVSSTSRALFGEELSVYFVHCYILSPAMIAWEYGPIAPGALVVATTFFMVISSFSCQNYCLLRHTDTPPATDGGFCCYFITKLRLEQPLFKAICCALSFSYCWCSISLAHLYTSPQPRVMTRSPGCARSITYCEISSKVGNHTQPGIFLARSLA